MVQYIDKVVTAPSYNLKLNGIVRIDLYVPKNVNKFLVSF